MPSLITEINMALPKLVSALLFGLLTLTQVEAGNLYCCQDPTSGRRACGDILPDQCKGHAFKVIDSAGNVIREVGPPLTSEQKAQNDADLKKKKELEEFQRSQRRKDAALLETYANVQEIEKSRLRAEEEVLYGMRQAEKRIADTQARRNVLLQEAEFYKRRTPPPELSKGLKDTENEIAAQQNLLDSKQKDLESVRAKFAEDKKRYLEITTGSGRVLHPAMGGGASPSPSPSPSPAPPPGRTPAN